MASISSLPFDAWAAVGQYLDPVSLVNVATTCESLHSHISSNPTLWSTQAARRWETGSWGPVQEWPGAYKAGNLAACQLSTHNPWTCSLAPALGAVDPPATAQILLAHTGPHCSSRCRCSCSRTAACSTCGAVTWQPPDAAAASLDHRLHWRRLRPAATAAAAVCSKCRSATSAYEHASSYHEDEDSEAAEAGDDVLQGQVAVEHYSSDPKQGHTAFIDALIQVPTGGSSLCFVSGARDTTIKLWTPFAGASVNSSPHVSPDSNSSSRSMTSGLVRPSRTLRGHTGSITSLLCLSAAAGIGNSGSSVLASASADKTIKLWSLSSTQQSPAAAAAAGSGSKQQGGTVQPGRGKAGAARQQGHNPLLATLRGHSDCITSLLLPPMISNNCCSNDDGCSSSGSSGGSLMSGGRDGRLKLWDASQGGQSCVSSWRLGGPCDKLLGGLSLPGCLVALLPNGLQVVDLRVPRGGCSTSQGVLTLSWPGGLSQGSSAVAAACDTIIAAGGRKGVRAWDLRATTAASSSSSSSSRVLLSARMPHNEPVAGLHLDRVKLVASTRRVVLHSAASIAVWSMPSGHKVQHLSSTLSAITLQHPNNRIRSSGGSTAPLHNAWHLIQAMSGTDADEALFLLHQHQQHQQAQQQQQQQQEQLPPPQQQQPGLAHEEPLLWQQQQQQQQLLPDWWADHYAAAQDASSSDDEDESSASSDDSFSGHDDSFAELSNTAAGRSSSSSSNNIQSAPGRIEPGVLALAVQGPVIACVDTVGNVLLRDFTQGTPPHQALKPYLADTPLGGNTCGSKGSGNNNRSGSSSSVVAENGACKEGGRRQQPCHSSTPAAAGEGGDDVAAGLLGLKFWRSW